MLMYCICLLLLLDIFLAKPHEERSLDSLINDVFLNSSQINNNTSAANIDSLISKVFNDYNIPKNEEATQVGCQCVPSYLCPKGTMITDGAGLIDIRTKLCPEPSFVCCNQPLVSKNSINSRPYTRKGCGQQRSEGIGIQPRIVGPEETQYGEFPWMIAIFSKSGKKDIFLCGGALIHQNVVLTVAHCIEGKKDLFIRAGEWNIQTSEEIQEHQEVKVNKTFIHTKFNRLTLSYDFSLLLLSESLILGEHVDIVCLPSQNSLSLNEKCVATGWGVNKFGKNFEPEVILKKVDLPMISREQCVNRLRHTRLGPFFRLHESFVCAGGIVGKDTCKGDGGSPLICPVRGKADTYEAVGLVAWGIGCGSETPGVYANTAKIRHWIDEYMKGFGFTPEY